MKRKSLLIIFVVLLLFIILACKYNKQLVDNNINDTYKENSSIEESNSVKILINEKEYAIDLELNETTKSLINNLPIEFNMSELNGNEKYKYLNFTLPVKQYNPKRINKGDVMLYGDNCIVIFYKSFDTPYSYTKIGHIDNMPDLGDGSIKVKIEKKI